MAEYKVVSWSPGEVVTAESLNALAGRDDWLKENAVTGKHTYGTTRTTGVKLVNGLTTIAANTGNDRRTVRVNFGNFFSSGCRPVVTTSVTSTTQAQLFVNITGPGSIVAPTREGFDIQVIVSGAYAAKNRKLKKCYVSWIAMGY